MKQYVRKIAIILFILVLNLILFRQLININRCGEVLQIRDGLLNLSGFSLSSSASYQLQGEWKVYNGEISSVLQGETRKSLYKTYILTIIDNKRQRFGMMLSNFSPAYKLWINGQLVSQNGNMAEDTGRIEPQYRHEILEIPENLYTEMKDLHKLDIMVQTLEYENIRPNFNRLIFGTVKGLKNSENIMIGLNLFAIGVYLTLLLFSFSLYYGGKRENYLLYFGFINLVSLTKSVLNANPVLLTYIMNVDYFVMKKVDVSLGIINALLLFVLYNKLYPGVSSKKINKTMVAVNILTVVSIFAFNYNNALIVGSMYFLTIYFVLALLSLYINITAILQNQKGAFILLTGLLIYIISALFTIFTILNILPYGTINLYLNPAQYGSLIFVMSFSVVVAVKYARRFDEADKLSSELGYINENLEKIVGEKTEELKNTNEKLTSAYKRVIKAQQEKRMLLMNVSHDLRTPITIIIGYIKALQEGMAVDEKTKNEFLERIIIKTWYLNKLINDLFLLGRLEDNKVQFYKSQTDINDFLKHIVEDMRVKMEEKDIKLVMKLDETIDYKVAVDKLRLSQAVNNIINNAIKYTEKTGIIEVATQKRENGRVLISFKDSGSGINEEDLPHIFKRYYKDKKKKKEDEATGLGLCIAKEIVERHNGRVWAESTPGKGSIFYILL